MTAHLKRLALRSFWILALSGLVTNIAVGEAPNKIPETKQASDEKSVEEAAPIEDMVSDGTPIFIEKYGIEITPPQGWEVKRSNPRLTLAMQAPEPEKLPYDVPIYQRTITLLTMHEPSPIDAQRAEEFRAELQQRFGELTGVSDFQIVKESFMDYKAKNDGLVVYTTFMMGKFHMMQMHMLVSGDKQQHLLSYTDLAERFQKDEELFNTAWQAMASIKVPGMPASRYGDMLIIGSIVGGIFLLMIILLAIRSRRAKNAYLTESDRIYDDNSADWAPGSRDSKLPITRSGVWNLKGAVGDNHKENTGLSFVTHFS